jgi:hypothetical protein
VNNKKNNFTPSQKVYFFDMSLKSHTIRACITPQCMDSILLLLQQFQLSALVKVRKFQQLMGMLGLQAGQKYQNTGYKVMLPYSSCRRGRVT